MFCVGYVNYFERIKYMKLDKNNFGLRIIDINAGWMLVEYDINGKMYTFDISSAIGAPL